MKRSLLALTLLSVCPFSVRAADCPGSSDACQAGSRQISPFLRAGAGAERPAEAAARTGGKSPAGEIKTAPAPSRPGLAVSSAAAPVPERVETFSRPLWSVFAFGAIAGLYFYLRSNAKKGKNK